MHDYYTSKNKFVRLTIKYFQLSVAPDNQILTIFKYIAT